MYLSDYIRDGCKGHVNFEFVDVHVVVKHFCNTYG